jgi:hypothetical protein
MADQTILQLVLVWLMVEAWLVEVQILYQHL